MPTEFKVRVTLKALVSPSEDMEVVVGAMTNILGGSHAVASKGGGEVTFVSEEADVLDLLRNQLRDRHIRGAARRLLLSELKGNATSLMLNRQAAAVGVVALCNSADQSPLGPIYARLESEEMEAVIEWLTAYESE